MSSSSRARLGLIATYTLHINVGGFDIDHVFQNRKAQLAAVLRVVCQCRITHQVGLRPLCLLQRRGISRPAVLYR